MYNRGFLTDGIQGFLTGLIFILLGMGTLLPIFMIFIFLGGALTEEQPSQLPERVPQIKASPPSSNQIFAEDLRATEIYYLDV